MGKPPGRTPDVESDHTQIVDYANPAVEVRSTGAGSAPAPMRSRCAATRRLGRSVHPTDLTPGSHRDDAVRDLG
ncbi:hypothetical protein Rwratislav_48704 [Rhodococcus wratislaviensis IFP 2016]|nr:hypothetical protein Rwratislav_48704 [Rhodococcus wratislaviensis IFP 2016]